MRKVISGIFCFACFVGHAFAGADTDWTTSWTAKTIGGKLELRWRGNYPFEHQTTLDDIPVGKTMTEAYVSTYRNVLVADRTVQFIVLALGSGGSGCPRVFRVLQIWADGRTALTDEFGNCSETPTIKKGVHSITAIFRPIGGASKEKWVIADGVARCMLCAD
jgi:hypothetical protein